MQKTFVYPAALFCLMLATIACKKDQQNSFIIPSLPSQTINASVVTGENFTFVAGTSGALSISKQALHFKVSETANENGSVYYNYHPAAGFIGADEVTLAYVTQASSPVSISGTGCSSNHSTSSSSMQTIVIKLNVSK
jgi:hypothetical protein